MEQTTLILTLNRRNY